MERQQKEGLEMNSQVDETYYDGLHEECGVFGVYDLDGGDVASTIYYGLFALQHRGQESCGIAVFPVSPAEYQVLPAELRVSPVEYQALFVALPV